MKQQAGQPERLGEPSSVVSFQFCGVIGWRAIAGSYGAS